MNRQDPTLSSSSRREISPASENARAKNIGCMSGIFQLVCKYHNRRRFLTSGRKHEKNANVANSSPNSQPPSFSSPPQEISTKNPKLSCNVVVPRSPTLPPEMRVSSEKNIRTGPALVARLMGLSEIPIAAESAVAEKRRRLLGALEKCDEDLKALKKMIEVVKSAGDNGTDNDNDNDNENKIEVYYTSATEKRGELEASPVAVTVFDEFTRSAFCGYSKPFTTTPNGRPPVLQRKKKPGEEDTINISVLDRIKSETVSAERNYEHLALPLWTSKAMIESVNEVCRDIAWGERREIGRIGLTLQDHICRDLIEEIVKEMGCYCIYLQPPQLPLES
eukprot:XP_025013939.1 uncharacterized protein LOC8275203 isoform X2 [Ricinus communis]